MALKTNLTEEAGLLFSLVVPTVHRTVELDRLLKSISEQRLSSFGLDEIEVIVVDQNPDERLLPLLQNYQKFFKVVRLTAPPLGQSHAKNLGMKILHGRYVAFPDDDCFYAQDTLEKVFEAFRETKDKYVLFGRGRDLDSGQYLLKYPSTPKMIQGAKNPDAFMGLQIAQFYTASMVKAVGDFDVDLCSGGKWGSGEETDYALRALQKGYPIFFKPELLVYHPLVIAETMEPKKIAKYAKGFGALCRKQGLAPLLFLKTVKQFLGFFVFFVLFKWRRAGTHWAIAKARLQGFWEYGKSGEPAVK